MTTRTPRTGSTVRALADAVGRMTDMSTRFRLGTPRYIVLSKGRGMVRHTSHPSAAES
jgi:hypothetical protein